MLMDLVKLNQILLDRLNIVKKILEDKENQVLELESVLSTNAEKVSVLEDSVSKIMAKTKLKYFIGVTSDASANL